MYTIWTSNVPDWAFRITCVHNNNDLDLSDVFLEDCKLAGLKFALDQHFLHFCKPFRFFTTPYSNQASVGCCTLSFKEQISSGTLSLALSLLCMQSVIWSSEMWCPTQSAQAVKCHHQHVIKRRLVNWNFWAYIPSGVWNGNASLKFLAEGLMLV